MDLVPENKITAGHNADYFFPSNSDAKPLKSQAWTIPLNGQMM